MLYITWKFHFPNAASFKFNTHFCCCCLSVSTFQNVSSTFPPCFVSWRYKHCCLPCNFVVSIFFSSIASRVNSLSIFGSKILWTVVVMPFIIPALMPTPKSPSVRASPYTACVSFVVSAVTLCSSQFSWENYPSTIVLLLDIVNSIRFRLHFFQIHFLCASFCRMYSLRVECTVLI